MNARTTAELVFSGTMSWYPNDDAMQFFLQEVWPLVSQRDNSLRLTIVGRGPTDKLRDLASRDSRVVVTGEVEDVRPFLHRAGIYVCPIRDGGGTRLKVLEGLAAGLPLIGTPLAVEGLSLTPGVHYLQATGPQDFTDAILTLRNRPELAQRLGATGGAQVASLNSWERAQQHLELAYQSVCGRTTSPWPVSAGN